MPLHAKVNLEMKFADYALKYVKPVLMNVTSTLINIVRIVQRHVEDVLRSAILLIRFDATLFDTTLFDAVLFER